MTLNLKLSVCNPHEEYKTLQLIKLKIILPFQEHTVLNKQSKVGIRATQLTSTWGRQMEKYEYPPNATK